MPELEHVSGAALIGQRRFEPLGSTHTAAQFFSSLRHGPLVYLPHFSGSIINRDTSGAHDMTQITDSTLEQLTLLAFDLQPEFGLLRENSIYSR